MATGSREPQLRRRLSTALPLALIVACLAARTDAQYQPSGYQPAAGEPFFLMSDRTYGSGDAAEIRLEITSGDFGMGTVASYGGVDVVLYRVPQPLRFLQRQRNLHRVSVEPLAAEEGLANALRHLWNRWYQASRRAWRAIFSADARGEVVKTAPELAVSRGFDAPTTFREPPQFKPLAGYEMVTRFRYPVHHAAPMQPPEGVKLAGSSSNFIPSTAGNIQIPLGGLKPGLYLVEAYVGSHRATTLVFTADTIAVTKASAREMVTWTAHRSSGAPVRGVRVVWTDGVGVLKSGTTDALGLARFAREAPERSYVFGEDPDGGVFISENFYYDSEIYDAKLYATTDRPLYRPGDEVFVKLFAREFRSARASASVSGAVTLVAYDPAGAPVARQTITLDPASGGDTSFRLPDNSTAGGYELRLSYDDTDYAAAFRVAEYQKPHFEITLVPDKADFKSGEPITGRLQLHYVDGKPVSAADIQLTVRSQQLTTVDGELRFYGQFPIKLEADTLTTDARGEARFTIPAVSEPSRLLLTALATDGAAYRVRTTRELLVERGQSSFSLRADTQFTRPNDRVTFTIRQSGVAATAPASWEWVRLEDRRREQGGLTSSDRLELSFADAGSYTVHLRDARGNVVAAAPHWVSGAGIRPPAGTIEIVPSKERYGPGETADVLITFPVPVDDALLTLERDRVEDAATLTQARRWVSMKRLGPIQWQARVPVLATYAPNITFSVVYVKDGEYVFQNQGLIVSRPTVDIDFQSAREIYRPGERVEVQVRTTVAGKPVPVTLAVGVVDEMVYALQPEVAPEIYDFFFHARRNNVRTASSQDFISYDLAMSRSKQAVEPRTVAERRIKLLERPRRDDVDTAFWQPALRTDATGQARFSFVMPDTLTRWRITGRAMSVDGTVGQRTSYLRSDKDLFIKWTGPTWMRSGDAPVAALALFNQTPNPQSVELTLSGLGLSQVQQLTLRPGVNYFEQRLADLNGEGVIAIDVKRNGASVDRLETAIARVPAAWPGEHTVFLPIDSAAPRLPLPADARNIRVTFTSSAAAEFSRVSEDLLNRPYGGVEHTASRMIPLALALESIPATEARIADRLRQQLNGQRLRLAYMSGENNLFHWWGWSTHAEPFLTAYAYYADWIASRTLKLDLPAEHWNRLLDVYREAVPTLPLVQRALFLHFMQEMRLPVRSLVEALLADMQGNAPRLVQASTPRRPVSDSIVMSDGDPLAGALAVTLAARLAQREKIAVPTALTPAIGSARQSLRASENPLMLALVLAMNGGSPDEARRVLGMVRADMPTLERALALAWLRDSLRAAASAPMPEPLLAAPWVKTTAATGSVVWRWPTGSPLPATLALTQPATAATTAVVQFESAEPASAQLPVRLERRLHRVVKTDNGYRLDRMAENAPVSTTELYLDEVIVTPTTTPVRFAVVEAALPPGASVESTTWGINFPGDKDDELVGLERARHEPTRLGYVVPVDSAAGATHIRHLVRFSQKGTFVLPRARLYRSYQPAARAVEPGALRTVVVR